MLEATIGASTFASVYRLPCFVLGERSAELSPSLKPVYLKCRHTAKNRRSRSGGGRIKKDIRPHASPHLSKASLTHFLNIQEIQATRLLHKKKE